MKYILFGSFILTFLISGCDVRNKDRKSIATNIKEDSLHSTSVMIIDSAFDFGNKTEGEMVEYSYRFKNSGDYPLVVTNVSASCGCTVPEKPEEPVQPGETGYIKVKFNSMGRVGEVHKTVTVQSNANPEFPQLVLKGHVTPKTN